MKPATEAAELLAEPNRLARWALLSLLVMAGLGLSVIQLTLGDRALADDLLAAAGFLIYAAIGGLIVIRRNGHPTGWLLIMIGLAVLFADGLAAGRAGLGRRLGSELGLGSGVLAVCRSDPDLPLWASA